MNISPVLLSRIRSFLLDPDTEFALLVRIRLWQFKSTYYLLKKRFYVTIIEKPFIFNPLHNAVPNYHFPFIAEFKSDSVIRTPKQKIICQEYVKIFLAVHFYDFLK